MSNLAVPAIVPLPCLAIVPGLAMPVTSHLAARASCCAIARGLSDGWESFFGSSLLKMLEMLNDLWGAGGGVVE